MDNLNKPFNSLQCELDGVNGRFGIRKVGKQFTTFEIRMFEHARLELRSAIARAIALCTEIPSDSPCFPDVSVVERRLRHIFLQMPAFVEVEEAGLSEWIFGEKRLAKFDETLCKVNRTSGFVSRCLEAFVGPEQAEEAVEEVIPEVPFSFMQEKMPVLTAFAPKTISNTINTIGAKLAITARLFMKVESWFDKFLCVILMYMDITGFKLAIEDLTEALRLMFVRAWREGEIDTERYPDIPKSAFKQKPAETQGSNQESTFEPADECGVPEVLSAIVMIGGFFVYGKMPDKSETAKVIGSLATKFQNIGKISMGVHGGIKLYQTVVDGINASVDKFVDLMCPEQSSLRVLDQNKERITEWMDAVSRLDREDTYIRLTCDPGLHTEIGRLRDQADEYSRIYQSLDYRPLNITALFMKSLNAIIRISNKATHISLNVGCRPDPFCVYLFGEPGVGKSFISTELIHEVADDFKVPKFRRIYPRAMDEKFWSDYSQQFAVVIDDFGQLRDPVMFDPYAELIAIKSNVPKTVQMAEVSEKGRQFLSQMISISSNIAYPNPNSIQSKEALWRRRDCLIEVKKHERFDVHTVEVGNTSHLRFRFCDPVMEGVPLSEWMTYDVLKIEVVKLARLHLERQEAVAKFLNRRESVSERGDSDSDVSSGEDPDEYEYTRNLCRRIWDTKPQFFTADHRFVNVSTRSHYWYSTRGSTSARKIDAVLFKEFNDDLSTSLARMYAAMNKPIRCIHEYPYMFLGMDQNFFLNIPPWWLLSEKHYLVDVDKLMFTPVDRIKDRANEVFRKCNPFSKEFDASILVDMRNVFKFVLCDGWYRTGGSDVSQFDKKPVRDVFEVSMIRPNSLNLRGWSAVPMREHPDEEIMAVEECGLGDELEAVVEDVEDDLDRGAIIVDHVKSTMTFGDWEEYCKGRDCLVCKDWNSKYAPKEGETSIPRAVCPGPFKTMLTVDRCIELDCIKKCAEEFVALEGLNASWGEYLQVLLKRKATLAGEPLCMRCRGILFEEQQSMTVIAYESMLSRMRERTSKFFKEHPTIVKVIAVTGAIAGAFAVYKLWAAFGEEDADLDEEIDVPAWVGRQNIEESVERNYLPNGRYSRKAKDTVAEAGSEYHRGGDRRNAKKQAARVVVSERGSDVNAEQIIDNRIMPCVVRFEKLVDIEGELTRVYSQNAFQIVGKLFLVNAHALVKFAEGDYVRIRPRSGVEYVIAFRKEDCAFAKEGDVAIYNAGPSVPSVRDSTKLVCTEKDLQYLNNFDASTIQIDQQLRNYYYHTTLKAHDVTKCTPYLDSSKIILRKLWTAKINVEKGECGGINVALVPQCPRKIVGMVSATFKNRPEGLFQVISQEMIEPLIAKFPQQIIDEGLESKMELLKLREVQVDERGDFGLGNIEVLEQYKIRRVGSARGTRIRPSPLFDQIFPHQTEPSVLFKTDPRMDEPIDPLLNGIKKYGSYHRPLPPKALEEAYLSLEQEILLFKPLRPRVGVLSDADAINGLPIKHYDRIDMKSSPGIPYVYSRPPNESGKAYLFDIAPDGTAGIASNLLQNEINARLAAYSKGERYPSIWTNCLKDERRSLEKIRTGNTRTFIMAPVDFTIVVRKYFLDFCAAFIDNRVHSFHAVGINADSSEWTMLFMMLEAISDVGFDGDYKNYDGFLFAVVMDYFTRVVNAWYNDGPVAALIRRVIMDEVIHTYSAYCVYIIMKNHGMPSGCPFTAILNSFGNSLIIRTGYLCLTFEAKALGVATRADCSMDSYRKNVKEETFGDDHVNAVTRRVLEWFNQNTYSDWLAKYGIGYTDSDKTLVDPPPFKKISECSFLKRGFVRDERFPSRIRAPIEMKTIQELINWVTETLDPEEQLVLNYIDALRFLFHYGEEVFNSFREVVDTGLLDLGILPPAYTYDYFQEEFDETFN